MSVKNSVLYNTQIIPPSLCCILHPLPLPLMQFSRWHSGYYHMQYSCQVGCLGTGLVLILNFHSQKKLFFSHIRAVNIYQYICLIFYYDSFFVCFVCLFILGCYTPSIPWYHLMFTMSRGGLVKFGHATWRGACHTNGIFADFCPCFAICACPPRNSVRDCYCY